MQPSWTFPSKNSVLVFSYETCNNDAPDVTDTLDIITHAYSNSTFWNIFYYGSYTSIPRGIAFRWRDTSYDAQLTVQLVNYSCSRNWKLALSVPYTGQNKIIVKNAIENCLSIYPSKFIVLFNTDIFWISEYFNKIKYVGSFNYKIGNGCAKAPHTNNKYIVSNKESPNGITVNEQTMVQIYFSGNELENEGISSRKDGIVDESTRLGVSTSIVNTVSEVDNTNYVMCLGVGAANEVKAGGKICDFQCGDDQNFGELAFYGQSVFNQGHMLITSMISNESFIRDSFRISTSESIDLSGSASVPNITDMRPAKSEVKVSIITHALTTVGSSFWRLWYESALKAVLQDNDRHTFSWSESGYNASYHAEIITRACSDSDAIGLTMPFSYGSSEYDIVDTSINDCIDSQPGLPIFSVNTDRYGHNRLFGYIGSYNYQIGLECALQILTRNSIMGLQAIAAVVDFNILNPVAIYLSYSERFNTGIVTRALGIRETFEKYGFSKPEVYYYTENVSSASMYIIALGSGAKNQLSDNGESAAFQCGDNMNNDISYYGQDVGSQAATAGKMLASSGRGTSAWFATIGNGATISKSDVGMILPPSPSPPENPPSSPPIPPPPSPPPTPPPYHLPSLPPSLSPSLPPPSAPPPIPSHPPVLPSPSPSPEPPSRPLPPSPPPEPPPSPPPPSPPPSPPPPTPPPSLPPTPNPPPSPPPSIPPPDPPQSPPPSLPPPPETVFSQTTSISIPDGQTSVLVPFAFELETFIDLERIEVPMGTMFINYPCVIHKASSLFSTNNCDNDVPLIYSNKSYLIFTYESFNISYVGTNFRAYHKTYTVDATIYPFVFDNSISTPIPNFPVGAQIIIYPIVYTKITSSIWNPNFQSTNLKSGVAYILTLPQSVTNFTFNS